MNSLPCSDSSSLSANRREFLSRVVALSSAAAATGLMTGDALAAQNKLPQDNSKCAPESIVIESETGAKFKGSLAQFPVWQRNDPKLGTIVQLEIVLSTFAHRSESVEKSAEQLRALASVDADLHRPPRVLFRVGDGDNSAFAGAVISTTAAYSLFLPDATPVRAHVLMDVALLA